MPRSSGPAAAGPLPARALAQLLLCMARECAAAGAFEWLHGAASAAEAAASRGACGDCRAALAAAKTGMAFVGAAMV